MSQINQQRIDAIAKPAIDAFEELAKIPRSELSLEDYSMILACLSGDLRARMAKCERDLKNYHRAKAASARDGARLASVGAKYNNPIRERDGDEDFND